MIKHNIVNNTVIIIKTNIMAQGFNTTKTKSINNFYIIFNPQNVIILHFKNQDSKYSNKI